MRRRVTEIQRLSIPYFPSQSGRDYSDPRLSSNSYMFNDDVNLYLFPSGFSKDSPQFSVDIDPTDLNQIERIGFMIGSDRIFPGEGLTKPIKKFFQNIAFHLAYEGRIYYEIASAKMDVAPRMKNGVEQAEPMDINILEKIPGKVFDLRLGLVQLIPIQEWADRKKIFVWLPKRLVWTIRLPSQLGGRIRHWIMHREMITCSELGPRDFTGSRTSWMGKQYIDILDFLNTRRELLARTTSKWGWQARSRWRDSSLEYFQLYRLLRFHKSMAVLRGHLLEEFNLLINRLQLEAKISYSGLNTEEDIIQLIDSFKCGELGFDNLIDAVHL